MNKNNVINDSTVLEAENKASNDRGAAFIEAVFKVPEIDGNCVTDTVARVACQGAAGAYSHIAAQNLFKSPQITFFKSWNDVFCAVKSGESDYGVLPIENSLAGSVNEVYDSLIEYGLKIVAAKKLRVSHCLLGVKDAKIEDIKAVYSHPQALAQCRRTLDSLGIEERFETKNTAFAAQFVEKNAEKDVAAIASDSTALLYNLDILKRGLEDAPVNYTRFVVISRRNMRVFNGNKISLALSIDNKEGSLYRLLGFFAEAGKNLTKLESRPIQGKNFEFMFYVDVDANLSCADTKEMLKKVGEYCNFVEFLGSYNEV